MVRWLCFSFLFIYFSSEKKRSTVGNYFVKSSKLYLHSLKSILPLSSWFYFVFKLGVGESSFPCAPLPLFIYITHSNLQHSSPFLICLSRDSLEIPTTPNQRRGKTTDTGLCFSFLFERAEVRRKKCPVMWGNS